MTETIEVSNGLANFYRWYLEQVTSPSKEWEVLALNVKGLCFALADYGDAYGITIHRLYYEQNLLFMELYGTRLYPFCTEEEFLTDRKCHTHPKRLAHAARFADWS